MQRQVFYTILSLLRCLVSSHPIAAVYTVHSMTLTQPCTPRCVHKVTNKELTLVPPCATVPFDILQTLGSLYAYIRKFALYSVGGQDFKKMAPFDRYSSNLGASLTQYVLELFASARNLHDLADPNILAYSATRNRELSKRSRILDFLSIACLRISQNFKSSFGPADGELALLERQAAYCTSPAFV